MKETVSLSAGRETTDKGKLLYNNSTFSAIKVFLISITALTMYPTSRQDRRAARLIYGLKYGLAYTPGQLRSWCEELFFLPPPLKTFVWEHIDVDPGMYYYLKTVFHDVERERLSILARQREMQEREPEVDQR